jgi:hypothetical protein
MTVAQKYSYAPRAHSRLRRRKTNRISRYRITVPAGGSPSGGSSGSCAEDLVDFRTAAGIQSRWYDTFDDLPAVRIESLSVGQSSLQAVIVIDRSFESHESFHEPDDDAKILDRITRQFATAQLIHGLDKHGVSPILRWNEATVEKLGG